MVLRNFLSTVVSLLESFRNLRMQDLNNLVIGSKLTFVENEEYILEKINSESYPILEGTFINWYYNDTDLRLQFKIGNRVFDETFEYWNDNYRIFKK